MKARHKRPKWYTREDAAADRAARPGTTGTPNICPAGMVAWFDGDCPRCPEPVVRHSSQVVQHGGDWIHAGCANGADDE